MESVHSQCFVRWWVAVPKTVRDAQTISFWSTPHVCKESRPLTTTFYRGAKIATIECFLTFLSLSSLHNHPTSRFSLNSILYQPVSSKIPITNSWQALSQMYNRCLPSFETPRLTTLGLQTRFLAQCITTWWEYPPSLRITPFIGFVIKLRLTQWHPPHFSFDFSRTTVH